MDSTRAKLVQSTLSRLQSPPERMQSQRNYGSCENGIFMARSYKQSLPKIARYVRDDAQLEQSAISRSSVSNKKLQDV